MPVATIAAVVVATAAVGSAVSQADASRRASHAAQDAAHQADPALDDRARYRDWIGSNWDTLSNPDPNAIEKNPNFQFLAEEGGIGIGNANARDFGSNRNGTYGEDMSRFRTGLASNFIQQQFQNNMATLGLSGAFGGFTTGNAGAAGQITANAGQNAVGNQNNMWGQIGSGVQMFRNNMTPSGGATPYFSYTGYDGAGGPAYG